MATQKKGDILANKLIEGGVEKAKNDEQKLKTINDFLKARNDLILRKNE
jgi:hypothetical protein